MFVKNGGVKSRCEGGDTICSAEVPFDSTVAWRMSQTSGYFEMHKES